MRRRRGGGADRGDGVRSGLAGGAAGGHRPRKGPARARPELPGRDRAARAPQRQPRRPPAERGRPGADFAVGRHFRRTGGMERRPLGGILGGGVAGRRAGRGFRRPAGLLRHRSPNPRDSAVRRGDQGRAQVHVGRARGRAHQAGGGGEVGPAFQRGRPRRRRQHPCPASGPSARGVRRRVPPRRPAAGALAGRTVLRRRNPGPPARLPGSSARNPDQRRRCRRAVGGSPARTRRHPGGVVRRHPRPPRRDAAGWLAGRAAIQWIC